MEEHIISYLYYPEGHMPCDEYLAINEARGLVPMDEYFSVDDINPVTQGLRIVNREVEVDFEDLFEI